MGMVQMILTLLAVHNITMNPTIPTTCQGCSLLYLMGALSGPLYLS